MKMGMTYKYKERQLKWFWHWINERHAIYVRRFIEKKSYPWTKDKILREYKFTNPFRQLDRVTQCWTDRFCRLLHKGRDMKDGDILFQVCQFRFFNWPQTYDKLYFNMNRWNVDKAKKLLDEMKAEKQQIFTGAYIITGLGVPRPKHYIIAEALDELYDVRHELAEDIVDQRSMEHAVTVLSSITTVGGFVAYELACDLRHTRLLADATDMYSWANPGPGAMRGIHRLLTGYAKWTGGRRPDYRAIMRDLYVRATAKPSPLSKDVLGAEWPFEMREIEHSLCEFDKYMRVKNGEGRPRSRYKPEVP
jgi:hypothetical protein